MNRFIVVADDLTGANATCAMIRKTGLRTASLLEAQKGPLIDAIDAVATTTNSRAMEPALAYEAVKNATDLLKSDDVEVYNKRIDSTLRGNLGPEIDGMLDALGDDRMAIAVPALPDSGRIVVNGTMLVNGDLLLNSDAGHDTITPVFSNVVEELFLKNLKRKARSIYLEDVQKGSEHLTNRIKAAYEDGIRVLIFDSVSNREISVIADAVLKSEVPNIAVDPGPYTLSLIRGSLDQEKHLSKVLMTVGSVTDSTMEQIHVVITELFPEIINVDAAKLIDPEQAEEEIKRAVALEQELDSGLTLLTTTPKKMSDRLNFDEESKRYGVPKDVLSQRLSTNLARISKFILRNNKEYSGIFVSGGDITVALTGQLRAAGIEILSEIVPRAAYGTFLGGEMEGLRIISKGGTVGDKNTMKYCVNTLRGV